MTSVMAVKRYTDFSIRTTAHLLKVIGMWTAGKDDEIRRRKISIYLTSLIMVYDSSVVIRDMYHCWGDFNAFVYAFCNGLLVGMAVFKWSAMISKKLEFLELITFMKEHFWSTEYDYNEEGILANVRVTSVFFISFVTFSGHGAAMGYFIATGLSNIGKNESERILPFNMWIDRIAFSPYYEVMFLVEMVTMYPVSLSFFCFDNIFCIMCLHLSGQFRILQYRLTSLCRTMKDQNGNTDLTSYINNSYEKVKSCVRYHQALIDYYERVQYVFAISNLAQVLVFSVLICLFGYQIALAHASMAARCVFLVLLSGSMFLLLMFTYSCDGVIEQSDNVGIGAYSAPWTIMPMSKPGKMIRKDLLMVVTRSKKVCCLTAYGFFPISLETYSKIISTAVSYFTILRQRSEELVES